MSGFLYFLIHSEQLELVELVLNISLWRFSHVQTSAV